MKTKNKIKMIENLNELPSPAFICQEQLLRKNLELLKKVQE